MHASIDEAERQPRQMEAFRWPSDYDLLEASLDICQNNLY